MESKYLTNGLVATPIGIVRESSHHAWGLNFTTELNDSPQAAAFLDAFNNPRKPEIEDFEDDEDDA